MQNQRQIIYNGTLPEDLIYTLDGVDQAIIEFVIGIRLVEKAKKYGLCLDVQIGEPGLTDQMVPTQIALSGQPYWITVWLLEYHPQYP